MVDNFRALAFQGTVKVSNLSIFCLQFHVKRAVSDLRKFVSLFGLGSQLKNLLHLPTREP